MRSEEGLIVVQLGRHLALDRTGEAALIVAEERH
jgi:hypothetical protein